MLRIEIFLSIAAILWAFAFPRIGSRWFGRVEGRFSRFAQRRALSVAAVGILAVVARLAVLPVLPVPTPAVHDEFSYLLMADTFAHGQAAYPTHPMWLHFETFYVNQMPTYVSKYFPAQGTFLAFGQMVFGHPFWGVLLSSALMCAAICWTLQGWMPPAWALLGGLLAVIRLGTFSYWANSYWGGAVAAIGGALVLGALPRIKDNQRIRDAVWMGIGLSLLFNSRPYESLFFATPVAIALLIWSLRKTEATIQKKVQRVILPLGIILTVTISAMALYFWKTTGQPFRPPYVAYERTHSSVPLFPWVHRGPMPSYSSAALRIVYEGRLLDQFNFAVKHPLQNSALRIFLFWLFYLGPMLTVPFVVLPLAVPLGAKISDLSASTQFLLLTISASFAGMLLPVYFEAHYAAPITAMVYIFVLYTIRYIRRWSWGQKQVGLGLARTMLMGIVLLTLIRVLAPISGISVTPAQFRTWASDNSKFPERAAILSTLSGFGGFHLVFVKNGTNQDRFDWVYNAGDIDSSKVVWARDLGAAKNQELLDYYIQRKIWIVDATETDPKLMPYPPTSSMRQIVIGGPERK